MANFWSVKVFIFIAWAVAAVSGGRLHHFGGGLRRLGVPAPAADCSSLISGMLSCVPYVQNGGNETKPDGACCSALKTVLTTDAECVCEGLKESEQMGIDVNMTKAMAMPSACSINAPPLQCNGSSDKSKGGSPAVSPAPAPTADCSALINDMMSCVPYVENGGSESKPDASCCSGLKTVLNTDANCVCEGLKKSAQMGIDVNMTKAMAMPSACSINAPPLSCNDASTGATPATSPAPAPNADCSALISDMMSCVPYVEDGGNESKPDASCCSGLKTVLNTNAACVCEGLKMSSQMGIALNMTKAMAMPSACSLNAPPLSCNADSTPRLAPTPSAPSAPAPNADCSALISDMMSCVPYVQDGGNESTPDSSCCSGLKTVLNTNAECVCEGLKMSSQMGIAVNMTKAMDMPAACSLNAPPLSCSSSSRPSTPAKSPAPSPAQAADCSALIDDMKDCIPYLQNGANETSPDASCCSGLKTVVNTNTECVCEGLKLSAQMGIDVNMTRATALPSDCSINNAPSLGSCNISTSPVIGDSPAESPEAPTPGPAADCFTLVSTNMMGCLGYLQNGGTDSAPDASCCSGLKTVLNTEADCVCEGLNASAQMGISVNMTRAETLSSACAIKNAPPFSSCNATSLAPGSSPGTSPAPSVPSPTPANSPPAPVAASPKAEPPSATPPASLSPPAPQKAAAATRGAKLSYAFSVVILSSLFVAFA